MRSDRREPNQLRELASELGMLERADGSARLTLGKTSVVVGVFGPRDISAKHEQPADATIEVTVDPVGGAQELRESDMASKLQTVLAGRILTKQMPRSLIAVTVQVICDDGSALAVAATAACLALLDAGLPMTAPFAGASCAINRPAGSATLIDPDASEENTMPTATFVFGNESGDPLLTSTSGAMSPADLLAGYQVCSQAARTLHAYVRKAIEHRVRSSSSA